MRTLVLCLVLIFMNQLSYSQKFTYSMADIPDSLRKNATVINKYDYMLFEVLSIGKSRQTVHQVMAILNKEGSRYLHFQEYTDKFQSLGDVEINVYDSTGQHLTRIKKKDLEFNAYTTDLVDDNKNYYYTVSTKTYPIIIEFKYEIESKGTLHYPDFYFQLPGQSVSHAEFEVKIPKEMELRYKHENIKIIPLITTEDKFSKYSWSLKNLVALNYEAGAIDYLPKVKIAPNKFEFGGHEGSLASWKQFGEWYGKLYAGRDYLPDERVQFFQNLVKDFEDDREKTRIIYSYLQEHFRYVSIQLGIGGLQPFSAELTDKNKYGDCKALSNFTKAALGAVGIKSYNAIIFSHDYPVSMEVDFPKRKSNHVILCVPQKNDTIWLECTSKTTDFDYLGPTTENRNALLLTENGGVLVATPRSRPGANQIKSYTRIEMDQEGKGSSNTVFHTTGQFREIFNHYLDEQNEDDKKQFLINYLGFKQPDDFEVNNQKKNGSLTSNIKMELEKIHEFGSGSKMFIKPRLYNLHKNELTKTDNRKLDYYFQLLYETSDTTELILPEGFVPDVLPKDKEFACDYGKYISRYWFDAEKRSIYSTCSLILNEIHIPASKYEAVQKFFEAVSKESSHHIVIKKE